MSLKNLSSVLFVLVLTALPALAADLTKISDTISDSRPGAGAAHKIQFTLANSVPASGKIIVAPEEGYFNLPAALDVDANFSGSVDVTAGTSGKIGIVLDAELAAGTDVVIKTGAIANPSASGSFKINAATQNGSGAEIDSGQTRIFIISGVGVSAAGEAPPAPSPAPSPAPAPDPSGGGGGGPILALVFKPADINRDGRVDLVDLSILLFNWGKPENKTADLNRDGVTDLVDFSILLFWWDNK